MLWKTIKQMVGAGDITQMCGFAIVTDEVHVFI